MSDIIVYGKGKTGLCLAKLVKKDGDTPLLYQDGERLVDKEFFCGKKVLVSPGVPPNAYGMQLAEEVGAEVTSELSFCFPRCRGKVISVTGTNGKTTVCQMIDAILTKAQRAHKLLGNGGVPFSQYVDEVGQDEIVVLESSSFQLRNAVRFAPYISVFTNVACDHISYHGSYAAYVKSKCNNFLWQNADQFALFNADDKSLFAFAKHAKSRVLFYSVDDKNANFYIDEQDNVVFNRGGKISRTKAVFPSRYRHNKSNFLAAVAASVLCGVDFDFAVGALADFGFAPHRLQVVCRRGGITYVDDSKGTNVAATLAAVKCFLCPVALIVGGSDKGEDFAPLFDKLPSNVVFVSAVGQTAERMKACADSCGKTASVCADYYAAVRGCKQALCECDEGVVLLSNACASFDMFDGYASRGEYFCKVVKDVCDEQG